MVQKQTGSCQLNLSSAVDSTTSPCYSDRSADFYISDNCKAYSTRGTPLQLAWRCFHSPETDTLHREQLKEMMNVLVQNGADTDWTEPDGTVVSKGSILAWCSCSYKQLRLQSEFDHAFCRVSGDTYEYPLYATPAQVERYRRTDGRPSWNDTGSKQSLDIEEHDSSEPSLFNAESSSSQDSG